MVVVDLLHDIAQQPLQHAVGMCQRVDELVDSLLFHLCIVQTDTQVSCQVELTSQIAQHALEERVDGLYAEIVVVMQQQTQCDASTLFNGIDG